MLTKGSQKFIKIIGLFLAHQSQPEIIIHGIPKSDIELTNIFKYIFPQKSRRMGYEISSQQSDEIYWWHLPIWLNKISKNICFCSSEKPITA